MDSGAGKVGDPAGVVEVHVGQHDVGHVGGLVAERPDLGRRGLRQRQHRPDQRPPRCAEPAGVGDVVGAESGVDEQQTLGTLHQQAVRHHPTGDANPERRAVQVMDHPLIVSGHTSVACSAFTVLELFTVSGSG
jgi:hypothetical protein